MKPDITCLKNLHAGQLHQLRCFVESLGYRKAAERATEEFNQPIHKTALQRFMRRASPADFLDDSPDLEDSATQQILQFAADGRPDFSASTVRALEQLAFQLALTCTAVEDDMKALAQIATMLCRFRHAATRERMTAVQEGKLKLRERELEKSNNSDDDAKIQELNERIAYAFRQHPLLTAIRNAESLGGTGAPPVPAGASPAEEMTAPTADQSPAPLNPDPSADLNPKSEIRDPKSSALTVPQCPIENAQCSMLNEPAPTTAPVPLKNKKTNRSSIPCAPSVRLSAQSAVEFPDNPLINEPPTPNQYEIHNPQSEIRNP